MRKSQSELLEAIKTLEDELFSVWNSLDKAVLMISEVNDEYFRKYDRDNKDDRIGICWDFARNAKYMEIIDDYVYQAKKALEDLEIRRNELKGAM